MSNIRRWHLPSRNVLLGLGALVLMYFYLTHSYAPNLSSAARGGNWNLDAEDSTGMKPPYKGGAKSVGMGMVDPHMPCEKLRGAEETLLVIKTDSTELTDRLPVHINTLLKCAKNHMIFSDFEEDFQGESIQDALKDYPEEKRKEHPDFDLHRRVTVEAPWWPGGPVHPAGRNGINNSERAGPISKPNYVKGKNENIAGNLDKWKYAPMMKKALEKHGDKKWFVFIQTNTYIFWKTMLNYLDNLDHTNPYYIGTQTWLGEQIFAHASGGIIVSHAALEKVVHNFDSFPTEWDEYTNSQWAGDAVLGKAFKNAGAPMLPVWPLMQSESVTRMEWDRINEQKRLWCHPVVSYGNLSPWFVEDLFVFDMEWVLRSRGDRDAILHHHEIYRDFVLPRTKLPKMHWNNHAEEDKGPAETVAECLRGCFSDEECVMYRLSADLRCYTSKHPSLGEPSRGVESGWVYDRMAKWYHNQPPCGGESFILSE